MVADAQAGAGDKGKLVGYQVDEADGDMSFLELLDVLNERLIADGEEPVVRPRLPRGHLRRLQHGDQR
jgi:hypothetical protein